MSSGGETNPPVYPAYTTGTTQPYQLFTVVSPTPGTTGNGTVPTKDVHHHDSSKEEKLEQLGEIDPASLIPGKGPGGAPQQYFNVSL